MVAAGDLHSLALRSEGTVWAWGGNERGQLGDGTTEDRHRPVQVIGLDHVRTIVTCYDHNLALRTDGTVWAWGRNDHGQLGDGTTQDRKRPVRVRGVKDAKLIAACEFGSLAVTTDGTVWVWGFDEFGQLGGGPSRHKTIPVPVEFLPKDVIAISAAPMHCLALRKDGTVLAWGRNVLGQLGRGPEVSQDPRPEPVSGLKDIVAVSAGSASCLALKADGTVWGWGANTFGQLGFGTKSEWNFNPPRSNCLTGIVAISMGSFSSCLALRRDGTVWSSGVNVAGGLGDGTTTDRHVPVEVKNLRNVVAVAAGGGHSVALGRDGSVYAWGHNRCGQLGDGTLEDRLTPVKVADFSVRTCSAK